MEVCNFLSSLDHTTDHSIIFTTSTFTAEAMKESLALGKTTIRLVPLDQLIEMLKNLKLGVGPERVFAEDTSFFEQYRKSRPAI